MEFQTLKRSHLKRNIIIGLVGIAVISAIILNFTRAKYRVTQSIPLVNGTINYSPGDIIISAYFNDKLLDTFPTKESGYSVESVTCDKNATATFNESTWEIEVNNFTQKNTKCDVHFIEKVSAKDTLLANYPTVLTRDNFATTVENTTTGTIYKSKDSSQYDDYGEVYYFAGNPTDNWVKFAGFYWRIIRINGDGTLRVIYQGTSANAVGEGTQLSDLNIFTIEPVEERLNIYVGYMYTMGEVHGVKNNSYVKSDLDNWYNSNLNKYTNMIDGNVGFCGDRTPSSGSGIGTKTTTYGAYNRLLSLKEPTYKCSNSNDLYTTNISNNGNKALIYPIGLITADEVAYAGGVYGVSNQSYYLNTNQGYWTISPYMFDAKSYVFRLDGNGSIYANSVSYNGAYGIRPVINLKAEVKISGSGTTKNPYVIEGAE